MEAVILIVIVAAGVLLLIGLAVVYILVRRRLRRSTMPNAGQAKKISVVMPSMVSSKKRKAMTSRLFDSQIGDVNNRALVCNGFLPGEDDVDQSLADHSEELKDEPLLAEGTILTVNNKPSGPPLSTVFGCSVPVVPRGRKVSGARDVFNESTAEMNGQLVRYVYAALSEEAEESAANSEAEKTSGNGGEDIPIALDSAVDTPASANGFESTDINLATDESHAESCVGSPRKVAPEWLRPSGMNATRQCPGFLRYSVRLCQLASNGEQPQKKSGGTSELRVAVVTALALANVNGLAHVLTQVELVPPNGTPRSPAKFVTNKAAIRHTKAVIRGGKVVGGSSEEDKQNPYLVDAAEYSQLVLAQWKTDALESEAGDETSEDSTDLLPLQQRWPFHEVLRPFVVKASETDLAAYHLRLTVWARELASDVSQSPSEQFQHGSAYSSTSGSGSPRSPLPSSGGLLQSVKKRIRGASTSGLSKCSVRQVGEIIVPLGELAPLTVSQTRTDELAAPLTGLEAKRFYETAQRLKAYSNNGQQLLCMPGRLRLSLTYWQAPVHGLEVSVTTSVTLPSFIDQQKNKARDTVLKVLLNVNGKRVQEYRSQPAGKSLTPKYNFLKVIDLSKVNMDSDRVELVIAIKLCHPSRLGAMRSRTFAVVPLRIGHSAHIDTCKQHWTSCLTQPAQATVQDHMLEMDLVRLGMR